MSCVKLYIGLDKNNSITKYLSILSNALKKKSYNGRLRLPTSEMVVDLEKTLCSKPKPFYLRIAKMIGANGQSGYMSAYQMKRKFDKTNWTFYVTTT